ncbi:MAG: ABC transporter permease [Bacillota bacterium]
MVLYFRLLGASIRSRMQYKWDFLLTAVLYALITAVDFLTVAAILHRYHSVAGWTLYEVALLSGLASASQGLYRVFAAELDTFDKYLVGGEYDGLLIRPWPPLLSLLARNFDIGRIGAAVQGYLVITIGLAGVLAQGAPGWLAFYVYLLPLSGAVIVTAISIAVAGIGFFITRINDLQTFAIGAPITAAAYPADIFPRWLRGLLTGLLPVTAIGYIPVRFALGKGGTLLHLAVPFLAAAAAITVALHVYRWGERRYQSTGS